MFDLRLPDWLGSCFSRVFFVLFAPARGMQVACILVFDANVCAYDSRTIMLSIQSIDGEHDKVIYTVRQSNILR